MISTSGTSGRFSRASTVAAALRIINPASTPVRIKRFFRFLKISFLIANASRRFLIILYQLYLPGLRHYILRIFFLLGGKNREMPFFDLFFRPFFFNGLESFLRFLPLKVLFTLLWALC